MCKPSKPKAPKVADPVIITNPLTDANRGAQGAALAARAGRSSLRIPLDTGLGVGFTGRSAQAGGTGTSGPRGNSRNPAAAGAKPTVSRPDLATLIRGSIGRVPF